MLLARLDQLLIEQPVDRWVVLTGGPGMGKSAVLAQWLARREAAGNPVPHHFIRRGEYDWDDPAKLAASLVAQIVALFPAHPEPEAGERMHPAARLQSTLQRVSQHRVVPHGQAWRQCAPRSHRAWLTRVPPAHVVVSRSVAPRTFASRNRIQSFLPRA